MKKNVLIIIFAFLVFSMGTLTVNANSKEISNEYNVVLLNNTTNSNTTDGGALNLVSPQSCEALLGDPNEAGSFANNLQKIFNFMKYIGIVLCIALSIYDTVFTLFQQDKDFRKNIVNRVFKRFVMAILLFLLPIILEAVLTVLGVYGNCIGV